MQYIYRSNNDNDNSFFKIEKPEVIELLVNTLRGNDPSKRKDAAYDLGNVRNWEAMFPLVIAAYEDESIDVRISAIRALCNRNEIYAIPHLVNLLNDSNSVIVTEAFITMFKISEECHYFEIEKAWKEANNIMRSRHEKSLSAKISHS